MFHIFPLPSGDLTGGFGNLKPAFTKQCVWQLPLSQSTA